MYEDNVTVIFTWLAIIFCAVFGDKLIFAALFLLLKTTEFRDIFYIDWLFLATFCLISESVASLSLWSYPDNPGVLTTLPYLFFLQDAHIIFDCLYDCLTQAAAAHDSAVIGSNLLLLAVTYCISADYAANLCRCQLWSPVYVNSRCNTKPRQICI